MASAFLSTLLEQRKDVRDAFFDILADCIGQGLADSFKVKSWEVRVEKNGVDIRLDSKHKDGAWVILIENKLQAGSKQFGQLRRYYASQIQSEEKAHVVAAYLAPHALGKSEVELVKSSSLRPGDFALHVSWETVAEHLLSVSAGDSDGFVASEIKAIKKAIEDARKKWDAVERRPIKDVASETREGLQERFPRIKIHPLWEEEHHFNMRSMVTDVTADLSLIFEVEPNSRGRPVRVFDGDKMRVDVKSKFRLTVDSRRKPEAKKRWDELLRKQTVDIPGVGTHEWDPKGDAKAWLVCKKTVVASPQRMPAELTDIGASLLQWITEFQGRGAPWESEVAQSFANPDPTASWTLAAL